MKSLTEALLVAIGKIVHSAELHSHQLCNKPVPTSPELDLVESAENFPAQKQTLHVNIARQFEALESREQERIVAAVQRVVDLIEQPEISS